MRVVESRHHKMPAQVDHLGLWTLQLLDIDVLSDGLDPISANRDRLFPIDRAERAVGGYSRINIAVNKNRIRLGLRRSRHPRILRARPRRHKQGGEPHSSHQSLPPPNILSNW